MPTAVTGRLVTGIGTGLADLIAGVAVLDISGPTGNTSYWARALTDGDGRIYGVELLRFGTGQTYQVTFDPDASAWQCDCPDSTFRGRSCKHVAALHDALTAAAATAAV
jgi:hypothetical protein